MKRRLFLSFLILSILFTACKSQPSTGDGLQVVVAESFLADITSNIAGSRLQVITLMPLGVDPHAYEPTPRDIAKISDSDLLIINGSGFEGWLEQVMQNTAATTKIVEASAGLQSRAVDHTNDGHEDDHGETDPHFWLDPINAVQYVNTIRTALIELDPDGKEVYTQNADNYIQQLIALDQEIQSQVDTIPIEKRIIVTNHESFGYYADRYGFTIIGAVIPSISTGASPTAQQMAQLIEDIRSSGATALFIETGANPRLAEQIAQETGVKVITDLYTHSISAPDGPAPTYIDMLRYNTQTIVSALQ